MGKAFLVRPLTLTLGADPGAAAGTAAANMLDDRMGLVWRSTSSTGGSFILDAGAATLFDFVSLLSVLPTTFNLQVRAYDSLVNAQAAGATGLTYDSTALSQMAGSSVPVSGRQNTWLEPASGNTQRFWRFDITGTASAPEVARVVMGAKLQFSRNYSFGLSPGIGDTGGVEFSPTGAMLRRRGKRFRTLDIAFESLSSSEVEASLLPLLELVGNTEPVLIVTEPDANAERSRRMWFGFLQSEQKTARRAYDLWTWRATFRSVI